MTSQKSSCCCCQGEEGCSGRRSMRLRWRALAAGSVCGIAVWAALYAGAAISVAAYSTVEPFGIARALWGTGSAAAALAFGTLVATLSHGRVTLRLGYLCAAVMWGMATLTLVAVTVGLDAGMGALLEGLARGMVSVGAAALGFVDLSGGQAAKPGVLLAATSVVLTSLVAALWAGSWACSRVPPACPCREAIAPRTSVSPARSRRR